MIRFSLLDIVLVTQRLQMTFQDHLNWRTQKAGDKWDLTLADLFDHNQRMDSRFSTKSVDRFCDFTAELHKLDVASFLVQAFPHLSVRSTKTQSQVSVANCGLWLKTRLEDELEAVAKFL